MVTQKRGRINNYLILIISSLILLFLISFASAGFFGNIVDRLTGKATSNTTTLNITVGNSLPVINFVQVVPSQNPLEGTVRNITFYFNVTDADGVLNLNSSSAKAYFQRTGETTRSNISCVEASTSGLSANYSCTVGMWYFDGAGSWTINVSIKDINGGYAENSTTSFTYNPLTSFVMFPIALTWPSIGLTDTNTGSTNDPIRLNNTGNNYALSINVSALNLRGEITPTDYIYANNFTIENVSPGCSGTAMSNATSLNITSAILQRGNNTINNGDATSGQEEIFFCLKGVPITISSQSYSSASLGPWTVEIISP